MIKTIKNYYDAIFNKYDLCNRSVTAWAPPIDCETAEEWTYYEENGLCFRYPEPWKLLSSRRVWCTNTCIWK